MRLPNLRRKITLMFVVIFTIFSIFNTTLYSERTVGWTDVYTINVQANESFIFKINVSNIDDFSHRIFKVVYNPDEVELTDLYAYTPEQDLNIGNIKNTNITVSKISEGEIEFNLNKDLEPEKFIPEK